MQRTLIAALACTLTLAGCGGHPAARTATDNQPAPAPAARCQPNDWAMQCKAPAGRALVSPAPKPSVAQGIDFAWSCPSPAGHQFGGSYLSPDTTKNWTASCAAQWRRAGAALVFFWESTSTRALGGCAAGQADAQRGWAQGRPLGIRVLILTADFDETPAQAPAVASYFRCAGQAIGVAHVGGYGGYWTIRRLFDAHVIAYAMQTYAWSSDGHGGTLWDSRAQLEQYGGNPSIDFDRAIAADYGQTPAPQPPKPPKPPVNHHYERFIDATFLFAHGHLPLNERATVEAFDRRPTASAIRSLKLLRDRVWFIAHKQTVLAGPVSLPTPQPSWGLYFRGWRWQELNRRMAVTVLGGPTP